jgi:hypothetical protein
MPCIITLPAAWASALINDDLTGLDQQEARLCEFAVRSLARDGLRVFDLADDPETGEPCEPRFTWQYRLYSQDHSADAPLGGDVLDYIAIDGAEQDNVVPLGWRVVDTSVS